jgi:hypothetical protein
MAVLDEAGQLATENVVYIMRWWVSLSPLPALTSDRPPRVRIVEGRPHADPITTPRGPESLLATR